MVYIYKKKVILPSCDLLLLASHSFSFSFIKYIKIIIDRQTKIYEILIEWRRNGFFFLFCRLLFLKNNISVLLGRDNLYVHFSGMFFRIICDLGELINDMILLMIVVMNNAFFVVVNCDLVSWLVRIACEPNGSRYSFFFGVIWLFTKQ